MPELLPCVAEQSLVDHHCHGVLRRDADVTTLSRELGQHARAAVADHAVADDQDSHGTQRARVR